MENQEEKIVYQVANWGENFEYNKSRSKDFCRSLLIPNKQHGLSFRKIMAHPQGAAIYGIWILILGALSRQKRPRDGWLTASGHPTDTPWTPSDLALMWGRSNDEIAFALDFLSCLEIGWMKAFNKSQDSDIQLLNKSVLEVSVECPKSALERKGKEGNGKEWKKTLACDDSKKKSNPASLHKLCYEDFINKLKENKAYEGIDLEALWGKMEAWCAVNGKQPTRRRFINWLNRQEKPLQSLAGIPAPLKTYNGKPQLPASDWDAVRKEIDAKKSSNS